MYYSFYMNERMLLDNWKYYQSKGECNWLLKRTLMNDNTRTPEEKIQFYFDNRRIKNHYSDFFKEQAEKVREELDNLVGCFNSEAEMEYYLDHKYINDDYEIMDYGHKQRVFNMYRRYIELENHANDKVIEHLSYAPKSNYKLREHKNVFINRSDIKFIRAARKYVKLTVPQIEVLFGIIFFCRMNETETANLNTEFKMKQFMGCFDRATMKDFEYVVSHIYELEKEDDDVICYGLGSKEDWIEIPVTRFNNKLDLTKMAHKYITDIDDKRYCEMCLRPFKPTNNRQHVCTECKPKADAIKARMRKVKQRYIEKNGKDACCGKCTDCTRNDCANWWEYWLDEFNNRILKYKDQENYPYPRYNYDVPDDIRQKIMDQLLYDIKNVYTEEEKSEIYPWYKIYGYKSY